MTEYEEGTRVEVYDGDRGRWCPGTVQETVDFPLGPLLVVKSDAEVEFDLPLTWAIPVDAVGVLVRTERPELGGGE